MLIRPAAYLRPCSCGGDHFAIIVCSDGGLHPFFTVEHGRKKICSLVEQEIMTKEEATFLTGEVRKLPLPYDGKAAADLLGVDVSVIDDLCEQAAEGLLKIISESIPCSSALIM